MQPKQIPLASLPVKAATLLSAVLILNPLSALAEKIPVSNDGRLNEIFLESTSVGYKEEFVYFQTEQINIIAGFGDVRRTVADHVIDCRTGYWQITSAIGYRDSFTEPNIDLTDEFQGKTFFAAPGTPMGNLYKVLCR